MTLSELFDLHDNTKPNDNGCRIWPRGLMKKEGYPIQSIEGKTQLPTRLILSRKLGRPIGEGMRACHSCDVRSCFYEGHLFEGTQKENVNDAIRKRRMSQVNTGEQNPNSKFTEIQILEIRKYYEENPDISQRALGSLFGVSQKNIRRILLRETWKHL